MNYSEKLKDWRWIEFRDSFINHIRREFHVEWPECTDCGQGTKGSLHVHHRKYINGREPWEYSFDDLRLICGACHALIHDTEDRAREIIRACEPHVCYEFNDLLDELRLLQQIDQHLLKVALARAKNTVRRERCCAEDTLANPGRSLMRSIKTMAELEQSYIDSMQK